MTVDDGMRERAYSSRQHHLHLKSKAPPVSPSVTLGVLARLLVTAGSRDWRWARSCSCCSHLDLIYLKAHTARLLHCAFASPSFSSLGSVAACHLLNQSLGVRKNAGAFLCGRRPMSSTKR